MTEIIIHNGVEYSDEEFDCPPTPVVRSRVREQRGAILRTCSTVKAFRSGPHGGEDYEYEEHDGTEFVVSHGPYTVSDEGEVSATFSVVRQLWDASQASTVVQLDAWRKRAEQEARETELNGKPMSPEEHRRAIKADEVKRAMLELRRQQAEHEWRAREGHPPLKSTAIVDSFDGAVGTLDEIMKAKELAKPRGGMVEAPPRIDMRALADRLRARAAEKLHERITETGESGEICTDASGKDGQLWQLEPGERPGATLDAIREEIEERQRREDNAALDVMTMKRDTTLNGSSMLAPALPPRDFGWWTADSKDIDLDAGRDLIEGVLPGEGIIVMYGKEKTGKTQIFMDMGLHLSLGWAWRGIETEAVGVSYFNPEGGKRARLRVAAWCREHRVERVDNFRLSTVEIDLFSQTCDVDAVIADIQGSQPGCKLAIFDTLNRIMPGGDENAVKDMGTLIRNVDKIASKLGIVVGTLHHEPKAGGAPRGSGSLGGALNAQLRVVREQGKAGYMEVELLRDGEPGLKFGFNVKSVLLGEDRKGRPVTAAVAVPASELDGASAPERKLTDYQVIVLEALTQLVNERGQPNPGGDGFPEPGRVKVVSVDQLLSFATEKLVSANRKERPRIVARAITTLQGRGLVKVQDGLIWNPRHMGG